MVWLKTVMKAISRAFWKLLEISIKILDFCLYSFKKWKRKCSNFYNTENDLIKVKKIEIILFEVEQPAFMTKPLRTFIWRPNENNYKTISQQDSVLFLLTHAFENRLLFIKFVHKGLQFMLFIRFRRYSISQVEILT